MKMKLSKAHAERVLRAVAGSASGIEVIRDGVEYAVAHGLTSYWVKMFDNWPSLNRIQVDLFFAGQAIKTIIIDPDTFEPDWLATDREERKKTEGG